MAPYSHRECGPAEQRFVEGNENHALKKPKMQSQELPKVLHHGGQSRQSRDVKNLERPKQMKNFHWFEMNELLVGLFVYQEPESGFSFLFARLSLVLWFEANEK